MIATEADSELLENCCKTLRSLQSHESTAADVNNEVSSLVENLVKQIQERSDAVKDFDGEEANFNKLLSDLSSSLTRLSSLVNFVDTVTDDVNFDNKAGLFDLVLDLAGAREAFLREDRLDEVQQEDIIERHNTVDEVCKKQTKNKPNKKKIHHFSFFKKKQCADLIMLS
jgi:DNA repair ATPase RecN